MKPEALLRLDFVRIGPESAPTIVLCHGFGADMHDLESLASSAGSSTPLQWIFPQAPVGLPGHPSARAWFPRTEDELTAFATGADFHDLSALDPPALRESAREVLGLLEALRIDLSRTIIGGFSQGAMVAFETMLAAADSTRSGSMPAGLTLLSGSLVAAGRWAASSAALSGRAVFQSHGTLDPLLPFDQALRLGELIDRAGAQRRFVPFQGGHAIPDLVVDELFRFVAATISRPPSP